MKTPQGLLATERFATNTMIVSLYLAAAAAVIGALLALSSSYVIEIAFSWFDLG